MFNKADKFIKYLTSSMAEISGWVLAACMSLVAINVFLRIFFRKPILGTYEWVEILTAVTLAFGLAYCAYVKGHIAIDVVTRKLGAFVQRIFSIVFGVVSAVFMGIISYSMFVHGTKLLQSGEVSPTTKIPYYIFVFVTGFGFLVLLSVIIMELIGVLRREEDNES